MKKKRTKIITFAMNSFRIMNRCVSRKPVFLAVGLSIIFLFAAFSQSNYNLGRINYVDKEHSVVISDYFSVRQKWKTSNLGSILFKNTDPDIFFHPNREFRTFTVLIWKYFDRLSARHMYQFNNTRPDNVDFLEGCQFHNCKFTGDNKTLSTADAVVVHIQHGDYPKLEYRDPRQIWIILSDEAPVHTFLQPKSSPPLSELAGIFNWTMTYRSDADIPVPSGRTVPLTKPIEISSDPYLALLTLVPNFEEKQVDVTTAILLSNCMKDRMKLLNEIQKYLAIDVYGKCGTIYKNSCPGHFKKDCPAVQKYYFYLAFENSSCRQYLTEKVFYHAYSKGAIPIIIGPSLEDCEKLLPPNSFIHIDQFESLKEFAETIEEIVYSYEKLLFYHIWRRHFAVVNEHGYFGSKSYHYCRICEALNYNDGEISIYNKEDLELLFDSHLLCKSLSKQDRNKNYH